MKSLGAVEEGLKNTREDVRDIKTILERWEEEAKTEAIALADRKVKSKIIWAGMGTAAVAGISAAMSILIKKIGF
jgi:hypothetical protein